MPGCTCCCWDRGSPDTRSRLRVHNSAEPCHIALEARDRYRRECPGMTGSSRVLRLQRRKRGLTWPLTLTSFSFALTSRSWRIEFSIARVEDNRLFVDIQSHADVRRLNASPSGRQAEVSPANRLTSGRAVTLLSR